MKILIKVENPNKLKEFKKLNDYANYTAKYCRPLYTRYCNNLSGIINRIKEQNKDFTIEVTIS